MQNTFSSALKKFECRLVNSFGDGHNHELSQYNGIAEVLKRISEAKGFDGVLLGNVVCDNVSLDSLLLTSFGALIIEFKNYTNVAGIRITGQKEFQCVNADGSRMIKSDGTYLNVKGGSLDSPYDQAKKNRIAVCNTLKRVLGEQTAKAVYVGVAIVFNGSVTIEGIDNIVDTERRWLTVLDSKGLENLVTYISGDNTGGLTTAQINSLIDHMDANKDVVEKIDVFHKAEVYYSIGKYREAYNCIKLCDPYREEVILLKLRILFFKRDDARTFNSLIVENIESRNHVIRDVCNYLLGMSFYYGINGHNKDMDKALIYLSKCNLHLQGVEEIISSLTKEKERIRKNKEEETLRRKKLEKEKAFDEEKRRIVSKANCEYKYAGRIAVTSLIIMAIFFCTSIMLPELGIQWPWIAILGSMAAIGILINWVKENGFGSDVWFIRKEPLTNVFDLTFKTVKIKDKSFMEGDRLYKAALHMISAIIYFGLPMYLCCRVVVLIIGYIISTDLISNANLSIAVSTGVDAAFWLPKFLVFYFILNFGAIMYIVCKQLFCEDSLSFTRYYEKEYNYIIAVPDIWNCKRPINRLV